MNSLSQYGTFYLKRLFFDADDESFRDTLSIVRYHRSLFNGTSNFVYYTWCSYFNLIGIYYDLESGLRIIVKTLLVLDPKRDETK